MPDAALWTFYWKPEDAWQAMYDDCRNAQRSIDFEQYILQYDTLGRKFLSLFSQKAEDGVRIRLLCDMVGSMSLFFFGRLASLRHAGIRVRFFNTLRPAAWIRRENLLPRDHIKMMIVDRRIGYTGGVCFDQRMLGWRDTQIRLTGQVVRQMEENFDFQWQHRRDKQRACPALPPVSTGEDAFHFVTSHPPFTRNCIRLQLEMSLRAAERYAYLTSPFFIPSRRLLRDMRKAARRGADVRLLVSEVSDVRIADYVSQSYFGKLLECGVRVFLYRGTVMHAKTAVIDDRWSTVGSMNLDRLSLFYNHEANVVISHPAVAGELKERFLLDMESSVEMTLDQWRGRPLWQKIMGRLGRLLKYTL